MPRRSAPSELSNVYDRLHNLDDESVLEFRANYLFMKQAPMYVSLEKKYKETKKKNRELKRMIDLLNRQNMELMERFAGQRYLETTTECMLSERFSKLSKESEQSKPESEVEIVSVKKENIVYEIIEESEPESEPEPEPDQTEEKVVEESEEVVEESEEVVEESEEVVEEESEEVVEEEVVEEESEEVVEEEVVEEEVVEEEVVEEEVVEEEVVEEEVVEEEVVEEESEDQDEEEEGVYEITINEKRYYVSNETDSTIYEVAEDDEIGEEVGAFVNGVAKLN